MAGKEYDLLFKFVIIGDSYVGKTCFLRKITEDTFSETLIPHTYGE